MATLLIKAAGLSVGDVLALPMGKTATIEAIKPFGPKARFVNYKTEYGWSRAERSYEVAINAPQEVQCGYCHEFGHSTKFCMEIPQESYTVLVHLNLEVKGVDSEREAKAFAFAYLKGHNIPLDDVALVDVL